MRSSKYGAAIAAAVALALGGCTSDGLSPREVRGRDYASYVFSMYDPAQFAHDQATTAPAPKVLITPARIAVAQLGEVAPPDKMLEKLRENRSAFASVQPVSGVIDTTPTYQPNVRVQDYSSQQDAQSHAQRMRRYARDLGADYLFLFGGTVDKATTDSPWVIADATIIGAFAVPGHVIQAEARASGSLVDVNTGRVVLAVSADGKGWKRASTVAREGDEIQMLRALRDEVVAKLAKHLEEQVKERSAMAG